MSKLVHVIGSKGCHCGIRGTNVEEGSQERTRENGLELEALVWTQNCVCVLYVDT